MSLRKAKITLAGAMAFSALTIWAVHFQQNQEAEVRALPPSHPFPSDPILVDHVQGCITRRRAKKGKDEATSGGL